MSYVAQILGSTITSLKFRQQSSAGLRSLVDVVRNPADITIVSGTTIALEEIVAANFTQHRIYTPAMITVYGLAEADVWQYSQDEETLSA